MKEQIFLETIRSTLSVNSHIGDDCAYLKDLKIALTHDTFVEDVHFKREFSSPYQIGYKSMSANLSDIFASGAIPKYFTVSLSLPCDIDESFVKEFYRACEDASNLYGFEIVGGDLTGADKVVVSVCAIGTTGGRKIASRSAAKIGDLVVVTGVHGSSAAGLYLLGKKQKEKGEKLCEAHLSPTPQRDFSCEISTKIKRDYAMMDTSDGLMDALFKIAQASGVMICADFDKILYDKMIEKIADEAGVDYKDWVLYGGEDFQLVACLDESNLRKIKTPHTVIGRVKKPVGEHFVEINYGEKTDKIFNLDKTFNHFGGNNDN